MPTNIHDHTPKVQRKDRFHSRECLIPHKGNRIRVEGVLVHVMKPNNKIGSMYRLTFGSVHGIHHKDVNVDHVVIEMKPAVYGILKDKLKLFTRYCFTAKVYVYHSVCNILNQPAQAAEMGLCEINPHNIEESPTSIKTQPTLFTRNRIDVLVDESTDSALRSNLYARVIREVNDGGVEKFINGLRDEWYDKESSITEDDVIAAFYKRKR